MGLNMLSAPKCDDISTIWDTRSNECVQTILMNRQQGNVLGVSPSENECTDCEIDSAANGGEEYLSVPSICDLDVRLVNSYMHNQLKKSN